MDSSLNLQLFKEDFVPNLWIMIKVVCLINAFIFKVKYIKISWNYCFVKCTQNNIFCYIFIFILFCSLDYLTWTACNFIFMSRLYKHFIEKKMVIEMILLWYDSKKWYFNVLLCRIYYISPYVIEYIFMNRNCKIII